MNQLPPDLLELLLVRARTPILIALGTSPEVRLSLTRVAYRVAPDDTVRYLLTTSWTELLEQLPISYTSEMFPTTIRHRRRAMVRLLLEKGVPVPPSALSAAAYAGDLTMLRWLHARGVEPEESLLDHAAACQVVVGSVRQAGECDDREEDRASRSLAVLRWVVETYHLTPTSRTLTIAAGRGDLATVRWLVEEQRVPITRGAIHSAAEGGHLAVLRWLHERSTRPVSPPTVSPPTGPLGSQSKSSDNPESCLDYYLIDRVARNGHLAVVRWLIGQGISHTTYRAVEWAAEGGHLAVVKYLLEEGPLATPPVVSLGSQPARRWPNCHLAVDAAARHGHLEVVKYLHQRGVRGTYRALDGAVIDGHQAVVEWLHQHQYVGTTDAMDLAAGYGHLELLTWLHQHHYQPTHHAADEAARNGHLAVLEWLHHHHLMLGHPDVKLVARAGHHRVLEWLHQHRYLAGPDEQVAARAVEWAAEQGHFETVVWLVDHGYPCTPTALERAAAGGYLSLVKWLSQRTQATSTAVDWAATNGHLAVVKYLLERDGTEDGRVTGGARLMVSWSTIAQAAERGRLDVVHYLHRRQLGGALASGLLPAVRSGFVEVVDYICRGAERSPEFLDTVERAKFVAESYRRRTITRLLAAVAGPATDPTSTSPPTSPEDVTNEQSSTGK